MRRHAILALALCGALHAQPARAADPSEGAAAQAESLFQEGRKMMDARRYGEACPKFLASHKLAPAVGTLLNLADCYERNGQLASAWVRFHEALALAQQLGRTDRERTAKDRADKLEPRISRLTILSHGVVSEVKVDGAPFDTASLGTPVPIDPGKHTIEATAKGKKRFATTIDVSARSVTVDVPILEDETPGAPPESQTMQTPSTEPPPEQDHAKSDGKTLRTVGLVGMGVGVVGIGVGTFFGLRTSSKWADAKKHCTGLECDEAGVDLAKTARGAGTVSTIAFAAGGALLAGGLVLFLVAPSAPKSVSVGLGSIAVEGTF